MIVFVVTLTIVILSSQGKTVDIEDKKIVSTGIIKINIKPNVQFKAYIDDQLTVVKDSKIDWIKPGKITLRVIAEGYKEWLKELDIKAGNIHDVFVQLIPISLNLTQVTNTNIGVSSFTNEVSEFIYIINDKENQTYNGVWKIKLSRGGIFDFVSSELELIYSINSDEHAIFFDKNLNVNLSKDNRYLLLSSYDSKQVEILDLSSKNTFRISPSLKIPSYPDKIQFFKYGKTVIIQIKDSLYEYDFINDLLYVISTDISNIFYHTSDNEVYLVVKDEDKSAIYIYKDFKIHTLKTINDKLHKLLNESFKEESFINSVIVSNNIYIFNDNQNNYYWTDISNETFFNLGNINPQYISNDLRLIIYKNLINNNDKHSWNTIKFISRQGGKSNEIKQTSFIVDSNVQKIQTSFSNDVLFFTDETNDGKSRLWKIDYDGQNKQLLYSEVGKKIIDFGINNVDTLYLVLDDENNNIGRNLYKISLSENRR